MSSVTQRLRALQDYLPMFLQPRRDAPVLIDGAAELEIAYQIELLLKPLGENQRARVLWHVEQIGIENANIRNAFYSAAEAPTTTIPPGS